MPTERWNGLLGTCPLSPFLTLDDCCSWSFSVSLLLRKTMWPDFLSAQWRSSGRISARFAHEWSEAGNRQEMDCILSHDSESVGFDLLLISRLFHETSGINTGRDMLPQYFAWARGSVQSRNHTEQPCGLFRSRCHRRTWRTPVWTGIVWNDDYHRKIGHNVRGYMESRWYRTPPSITAEVKTYAEAHGVSAFRAIDFCHRGSL